MLLIKQLILDFTFSVSILYLLMLCINSAGTTMMISRYLSLIVGYITVMLIYSINVYGTALSQSVIAVGSFWIIFINVAIIVSVFKHY